MLKNRKNLSDSEIIILDDSNKHLLLAFTILFADPSNFMTNIAALKEIKNATELFFKVCSPHMVERARSEESSQNAYFKFFRNLAHEEALKESKIIETVKEYLFDNPINIVMKAAFAKEPRLKELAYDYNSTSERNHAYNLTKEEFYIITFSDDSTIKLNDLSTESLAKAKTVFEDKMAQLASANTLKIRA